MLKSCQFLIFSSKMCWLSMENSNKLVAWPSWSNCSEGVHLLHGLMKRPLCWEVCNDRPDYGSSSVCNEEMPPALITPPDWSQWSRCGPAWQLHFMTYFFNSAPWDPRWSVPLHCQRRCIRHAFLQIQWSSQARCCLVQGRMSHS